jgi:hypothetical protein
VVGASLFWHLLGLFGYEGTTVYPAKWRKPQKARNLNTQMTLTPVPLFVLAILGFLLHRYF